MTPHPPGDAPGGGGRRSDGGEGLGRRARRAQQGSNGWGGLFILVLFHTFTLKESYIISLLLRIYTFTVSTRTVDTKHITINRIQSTRKMQSINLFCFYVRNVVCTF